MDGSVRKKRRQMPLALTMVLALVVAMALPAVAGSNGNTINYTGQGFDDAGNVESLACGEDEDFGQDKDAALLEGDESGLYLKWVFTGSSATDVTLTGPWGEADMFQNERGTSAWMLVTPLYDLDELLDGQVFASWEGDAGTNPQLNVSNGCDGAKVTIAKVTVDNREGDFDFETDLGEDFTLADGESETFFVPAGDYYATEIVPENWTLNSIVCDASDNVTTETDVANATVDITVAGYDDVTCTFTNEESTGAILINKTYSVTPDEPAQFFLGEDETGTSIPMIEDGVYCIEDLSFGDYDVYEVVPEGFEEPEVNPFSIRVDDEGTCAEGAFEEDVLNQASPAALDVLKFKLDWEDGEYIETDTPLNGFEFALYAGTDTDADALETVITADVEVGDETVTGLAQFDTELVIGETYTVCETDTPLANGRTGYWTDADCQTVEPVLGDDVITLEFFNAPKADVRIQHFDQTGYTTMDVVCDDAAGNLSGFLDGSGTNRQNRLDLGDYECTIKIRNGGSGPS